MKPETSRMAIRKGTGLSSLRRLIGVKHPTLSCLATRGIKTSAGILMLLLLFSMAALVADAESVIRVVEEDNGYWTETVDDEGMVLCVFTYTEPVESEPAAGQGYGTCGSGRMVLPSDDRPLAVSAASPGLARIPALSLSWIQRTTLILSLVAGLGLYGLIRLMLPTVCHWL